MPTSSASTLSSFATLCFGAALAASATLPAAASAKDLSGRFGVGFNNQLGGGPALAVRYAIPTGDESPLFSFLHQSLGRRTVGSEGYPVIFPCVIVNSGGYNSGIAILHNFRPIQLFFQIIGLF